MYNGDFLKTLEELHSNRGVLITEIAGELGISKRMIYYLKKGGKRFTVKILKRADMVFPDLLSRNPRLRRPGVYFLKDSEDTVTAPASTSVQDEREGYRLWRKRLPGKHLQGIDDPKAAVKAEEIKMARERERIRLGNLGRIWWGRK